MENFPARRAELAKRLVDLAALVLRGETVEADFDAVLEQVGVLVAPEAVVGMQNKISALTSETAKLRREIQALRRAN